MAKINLTNLSPMSVLLATLFLSAPTMASEPLVNVQAVEGWENGLVSTLNCQVSVPYLTVFSSDSSAELTFLLPKGASVKKGQLIAQQDDYYLKQQLTRLQQQKASSEAELKYSVDEYNRLLGLAANMVSPSQLSNLSLKRAQAELSSSVISNEIAELKYRIKNLKHFATNSGVVAEIFTNPGAFLHQGDKIVSFLPDIDKEIDCEVPIARFDNDNIMTTNTFSVEGSSFYVKRINQITQSKSQFVNVYLAPKLAKLDYLVGQRVKVKMSSPNPNLTRLPVDSVNLASNGDYVWRVSTDGSVEKVSIKVVDNHQGYFLVDSILKSGDQVVTLGKIGLKDKQKVSFYQAKGAL